MGDIRRELAEILGVTPCELYIAFERMLIQDDCVIKDYLETIKEKYQTQYLSLRIKASEEPKVAKVLEQKILKLQDRKEVKSIVLENLNPIRETELTLYRGHFNSYMAKTFK